MIGKFLPKKRASPDFPWTPFIALGVIVLTAGGLRLWDWAKGPDVPTADVPSLRYEEFDAENPIQNPNRIGLEPKEEDTEDPNSPVTSNTSDTSDTPTQLEPSLDTTTDAPPSTPPSNTDDAEVSAEIPTSFNLAVPFTSQAPFGDWDVIHEDTCEEASFYMTYRYYSGHPEGKMDPTTTDKVLYDMVRVQDEMGYGYSISAEQFVTFAKTYDGSTVRIVENPSVEDLKEILAGGDPIIVPAYGRRLGNPFFTGEGPLYHMLVLRGYTETTFITNDPGTRQGNNYQYDIDVLMNAIGDWDGDSPDGGKRVMVMEAE